MRTTDTMFGDDYGVRYSRGTFVEAGVRGDEAWRLYHRKSEEGLRYLAQAA